MGIAQHGLAEKMTRHAEGKGEGIGTCPTLEFHFFVVRGGGEAADKQVAQVL